MPFRETPPQPQSMVELPSEQVPLEIYVAAKRAHIEALRARGNFIVDTYENFSEGKLLIAEAQVLEHDLQNFLFTVRQHQLAEELVKQQQQQQIITATLARKPGRGM